MIRQQLTVVFTFLAITGARAAQPLALIYKGPGSCEATLKTTGCSDAAAAVARMAGFDVQFIGTTLPKDLSVFSKAAVWIQPGGRARIQVAAMDASLKEKIKEFVASGKGYVGFCAGGFLASERFGWQTKEGPFEAEGLGIIPGKSHYYNLFDKELSEYLLAKILTVSWLGKTRDIYWELGPYFNNDAVSDFAEAEVVAKYPELLKDGQTFAPIMTLRGKYQKGRVYVTAIHPEAPQNWRDYYKLNDTDGVDTDLAKEMVQWSAQEHLSATPQKQIPALQ